MDVSARIVSVGTTQATPRSSQLSPVTGSSPVLGHDVDRSTVRFQGGQGHDIVAAVPAR